MRCVQIIAALLFAGSMPATIAAQSGCSSTPCLDNSLAHYDFSENTTTGAVNLSSGYLKSDTTKIVTFLEDTLWSVELRTNPADPDPSVSGAPPITFTHTDLSSFSPATYHFSDTVVLWTWTGTLASTIEQDPEVIVNVFWRLNTTEDFLRTIIGVEIVNEGDTSYRLWNVRYPKIRIESFGGGDALLSGERGGLLYRNPINYVDINSGNHLKYFSQDLTPKGLASRDLNAIVVPLHYFYDQVEGYGVYLSNGDDENYFKGIRLEGLPGMGPGSIDYEVIQHPSDPLEPIYKTTSTTGLYQHDSEFEVHVGVVHGDWVDAAQKHRDYRLKNTNDNPVRYSWLKQDESTDYYPWPVGHPLNDGIPQDFKSNIVQYRIAAGDGYCPGTLNVGDINNPSADPKSAAGSLDFLSGLFGLSPMVQFDRFQVAYDEITYDTTAMSGDYSPNTSAAAEVHTLMTDVEMRGHGVILDSMTEKFYHTDDPTLFCNPHQECAGHGETGDCSAMMPPAGCIDYCCSIDPAFRRLAWHNAQLQVSLQHGSLPCTMGESANRSGSPTGCTSNAGQGPLGISFSDVFVDNVVEAAGFLSATGGMRFNFPTLLSDPCFSLEHNRHPAGFGNFMMTGWYSMLDDIRLGLGMGNENMPFIIEGASSTVTERVRLQNPRSFDLGADSHNSAPIKKPARKAEWNDYFGAPITSVPLLQLVAPEVRYATQYTHSSMSLPFTNVVDLGPVIDDGTTVVQSTYFKNFPAVVASLSAWNMAERCLANQASLVVSNVHLADEDYFEGPVSDLENEKYAAQGMLDFYLGLQNVLTQTVMFSMGPSPRNNMNYFCGSMERPVQISITNASESFVIAESTISPSSYNSPFPDLELFFSTINSDPDYPGHPTNDLRWDEYRPVDQLAFMSAFSKTIIYDALPEEGMSWLPSGVYRHWDYTGAMAENVGTNAKLAIFVANPWGITHESQVPGVLPPLYRQRPMNPFTFNYRRPHLSGQSNAYDYEFMFTPEEYGMSNSDTYTVFKATFGQTGSATALPTMTGVSGVQTISSTLDALEFDVFYIEEMP